MRAIDIRRLERVAKKYEEIEHLLDMVTDYTYRHDEPFNKNTSLAGIVCGMLRTVQGERQYVEGKIHAIKEMSSENQ
jgi:hypothetical protein